jgi:hypothetical protein
VKIVNFELNPNEDVSIYQTGHCGGTCFSRYAKEILNRNCDEFWIIGQQNNFKNIKPDERKDRILVVNSDTIEALKLGYPISQFGAFFNDVDIVIHNYGDISLNLIGLKAKQVCWYSFVNQTHQPNTPYCFVYSRDQNVRIQPNTKIFDVKIGKPVKKDFRPTVREDFIFQCTRNDDPMDTITTAKLCQKYGIKGYFGGPILNNYPLLNYIDNINTFYLGCLTEEQKLNWSSRARLYTCIQNWDTIFSLSAIEALGQGTPIIARNRGCFKYLINDSNGFFFKNDDDFLNAYQNSVKIDQNNCYNKALEYSEIEMVNSFYKNFELILRKE